MKTLDFCGFCGALCPEGQGTKENPRCENCDNDIYDRDHRVQGQFVDSEAAQLREVWSHSPEEDGEDVDAKTGCADTSKGTS